MREYILRYVLPILMVLFKGKENRKDKIITNKQPITLYQRNEISVNMKQLMTTISAMIAETKVEVAFTFLKKKARRKIPRIVP